MKNEIILKIKIDTWTNEKNNDKIWILKIVFYTFEQKINFIDWNDILKKQDSESIWFMMIKNNNDLNLLYLKWHFECTKIYKLKPFFFSLKHKFCVGMHPLMQYVFVVYLECHWENCFDLCTTFLLQHFSLLTLLVSDSSFCSIQRKMWIHLKKKKEWKAPQMEMVLLLLLHKRFRFFFVLSSAITKSKSEQLNDKCVIIFETNLIA